MELVSVLHNSVPTFLYNVVGNLAWFVPLGILGVYVFSPYSIWKAAILGMSVSFSIEVMQFIFANGISDIDDLILNTIGAMIGYGCVACYQKFHKKASTR